MASALVQLTEEEPNTFLCYLAGEKEKSLDFISLVWRYLVLKINRLKNRIFSFCAAKGPGNVLVVLLLSGQHSHTVPLNGL